MEVKMDAPTCQQPDVSKSDGSETDAPLKDDKIPDAVQDSIVLDSQEVIDQVVPNKVESNSNTGLPDVAVDVVSGIHVVEDQVVHEASAVKVESNLNTDLQDVPVVLDSVGVVSHVHVEVINADTDKVESNSNTDLPDVTVVEYKAVLDSVVVATGVEAHEVINEGGTQKVEHNLNTDLPDVPVVVKHIDPADSVGVVPEEHIEADKQFVQVTNESDTGKVESNSNTDLPDASVVGYTHLLDSVGVDSDVDFETDEDSDSMVNQLKKMNERMSEYEKQVKHQNQEINLLKEQMKEKDKEIEKYHNRNQDNTPFVKNRLKEKDKEIQNMKHELNRNRSLVAELQMNIKQIHNQIKSMGNNTFEFEDRLSDIEKLSPKMGVFEWRLECYTYHSQNSEFLCSPDFYTHLNGFCCHLSVQWYGNKNGRLGLYLHLDKKKNVHLVENCKINMMIQCIGVYGLTKEHVVHYDADDVGSDSSNYEIDDSIISGDHYFLLKPFLDKYLLDDCLYFYCYLLPDNTLDL